MYKIRGNKWNRRICKWIASLLTVALLINQNSFWVLAEENTEEVCQCNIRCSADSVNEDCSVCAQDSGRCEGAEDMLDNDMGEETENSGEDEGDTGADTETVPDTPTDEEPENPDEGSDTAIDEETEGSDADESETDADTEIVADVDTEDEVNTLQQDDETENAVEEDAINPAAVGDTFDDGVFTYKIIKEEGNNRQVEVTGHVARTEDVSGDVVIHATASDGTNPYDVVSIGFYAFYKCINLESIIIPDSVSSIGTDAFASCSSLKSITIPNGVTFIGDSAFSSCSSLESITIPDSVTSIGSHAFSGCNSLKSITIPDRITSIRNYTFGYCSSLESITIPDSVAYIGNDAFRECSSLKSIRISDRVISIDYQAFDGCSSLERLTIPNSVTSIEHAAFRNCSSLTCVTILNENINIDGSAFAYCDHLNSLQIALTENIGIPTVPQWGFRTCPDDRYLTFLTRDGTELSDTTTPKLEAAVNAYDEADGTNDGKWCGWKLTDDPDPDVTDYQVTINVNLDGSVWSDCGKTFVLSDNGTSFITDLNAVSNGTYAIYDITGASDSTGYVDTRVTVEVKDAAAKAEINYYSVTFYDGDTIFAGRIVPNNTNVSVPLPPPTKDGYTFYRWATSEDGSTAFNFNNPITAKTDVYASWIADEEELFTITASAGAGGSVSPSGEIKVKSGADQQFTITPEDGYRIASVLVDGNEVLNSVQTRDYSRAGLTDAGNNVKYYNFENVTNNHTLAVSFEAINPDGNGGSDDSGDNNGGGGSGGGDVNDNGGSGGGNANDNSGSGGSNTNDSSASDNSGGSDTNNNSGSDSSGSDNAEDSSSYDDFGNSALTALFDTSVGTDINVISANNTSPASKDSEPKTGDASHVEIYATITMIAGFSYLLLYFADGKNGMTEEEKKEIVASLVNWAKKGNRVKKYAALAVIFFILVYYHSIGKRTTVDWKEVYEK